MNPAVGDTGETFEANSMTVLDGVGSRRCRPPTPYQDHRIDPVPSAPTVLPETLAKPGTAGDTRKYI